MKFPAWALDEPRGVWRVCPDVLDTSQGDIELALWFEPDKGKDNEGMYCPNCGRQIRHPEGRILSSTHFPAKTE